MYTIKGFHMKDGQMTSDTVKKLKEAGLKFLSLKPASKEAELTGEATCPLCGKHYKLIERHKCKKGR